MSLSETTQKVLRMVESRSGIPVHVEPDPKLPGTALAKVVMARAPLALHRVLYRRYHGLTFSPATSIADSAKALGHWSISHSGVMGDGDMPRFVYLNDALLTGQHVAVSIWEIPNTNDHTNFSFLQSSLQQAKGGVLGVKSIEEVRIRFPEKANLAQWGSFLNSARHEGDLWFVGKGPALRFVPGKDTEIESIVLRVESLGKAGTALSQRKMVGERTPDSINLDPTKTWGLRITLKEK